MNISGLHYEYSQRDSNAIHTATANLFVSNAIRNLIQTIFIEIATSFVVTISTRYSVTHYWYRDLIEKLFATCGFSPVQVITVNHRNPINVPGRRYLNLILIDSYQALLDTDIVANNADFDTSEYYFIFLQTENILIPAQMDLIFAYCLQHYWIHCNVMVQTTEDVLVYTYFPFTTENCRSSRAVLVNQFDGDKWINSPMFPDKLKNCYSCPLKVISWHTPPFVYIWRRQDGSLGYRGFEMSLLTVMRETMNFTIDLHDLTDGTLIEHTGTNLKQNGPLAMLARHEANLSVGYFRKTTERDQLASSTFTHYYSPLVAVIIRKDQKYSSLEVLSFPFHFDTWILILVNMISIMAMMKLTKAYVLPHFEAQKVYTCSVPILRIFIGIPLVKEPIPNSCRLFVIALLISTFILRVIYQSLLFHLIRTDLYREAPQTFDALIRGKYKAIATINTVIVLREIPQVASNQLAYESINASYDLDVFDVLETHFQGNYFAAIAKEVIGRFGPDKSFEMDFDVIPEYIKMQQLTMYMPKHSYFVEKFNDKILQFESNGLLEAWFRWHLNSNLEGYKKTPNTAMLMGQRELIGIYIITAALLFTSFIVFLLELLSLRVKSLQRIVAV